jgi:hypothetical protein
MQLSDAARSAAACAFVGGRMSPKRKLGQAVGISGMSPELLVPQGLTASCGERTSGAGLVTTRGPQPVSIWCCRLFRCDTRE